MRRILSFIIVVTLAWSLFGEVIFAQKSDAVEAKPKSEVVDITADIVYPYKINDTVEVMCLVGNFAAQHNGAIITADSAVRYNDKRIECFGSVLINQNTTYGYADRAVYNGEENEVVLYAPIIKIVDGDAALYTYNFSFNTLDNIGFYTGGGVMINRTNVMEALNGYYYSNNKEFVGVDNVEFRGDDYQMKADSVIYNTETDFAQYFENTNIWNKEGDYLYADRGEYDKNEERYTVTRNGYILTEEQEAWSDTINYLRSREHVIMRSNIQLDDTTHKSLVFGNFGEYFKEPGDIFLGGNPVVVSYDTSEGDSLFMRADSFHLLTLNRFKELADSLAAAQKDTLPQRDSLGSPSAGGIELGDIQAPMRGREERNQHQMMDRGDHRGGDSITAPMRGEQRGAHHGGMLAGADSTNANRQDRVDSLHPTPMGADSVMNDISGTDSLSVDSLGQDSLALDSLDSLKTDSLSADTLNFFQRYRERRAEAKAIKAHADSIKNAERRVELAKIAKERQAKINVQLDAEKARLARQTAARRLKLAAKEEKKRARAERRGKSTDDLHKYDHIADSVARADSIMTADSIQKAMLARDTLARDSAVVDSLSRDSLALDSLAADTVEIDSMYRLVKGFRNVKIYRSDFQSICDSMVSVSIDSTIHLFQTPILWNGDSQITSQVMDIFTANKAVYKADFTGDPMMASQIQFDTMYYNQVAGKEMTALFSDGKITRNNVDGNAKTVYFMQDDAESEVTGMMDIESGGATFYFADETVEGITYRGAPEYTVYPMSLAPSESMLLPGFKWYGALTPTRTSIFDREVRSSQREEKREVPLPTFPLNEEFEALRERLTHEGVWVDRTDVVPAQAEAWFESLGFKSGQPREGQEPSDGSDVPPQDINYTEEMIEPTKE